MDRSRLSTGSISPAPSGNYVMSSQLPPTGKKVNSSFQQVSKGMNDVSRSRNGSFQSNHTPTLETDSSLDQDAYSEQPGLHATIVEMIPRVGILSIPDFAHDYRARDNTTVYIDDWLSEMDSNGYHVVVFETNGQSSLSASHPGLLHNQFVVFPALPDRFNLTQILNTMKAFMYWYYLDQRDCIVLFNTENFNRLSVCACLMMIDPTRWTNETTIQDFLSTHITGLTWSPSDRRFLSYISRLLKLDPNISYRPRSIMVKQLLIDSCFCEDSDLHVEISDSNGTVSSGESIVQFADRETRSIAIHFPRMKFYNFNENISITLSSRRHSMRLTYRFNTGFVDNLTSSVVSIDSSGWDISAIDDFVQPPSRFHVQVITVPVGLNTAQKILAPYSIPASFVEGNSIGKELFVKCHSVIVNEQFVEDLRGNGTDLGDVLVGLKVFENNFLDACSFLVKYCSHRGVGGSLTATTPAANKAPGLTGNTTPAPSGRGTVVSPHSSSSLTSKILKSKTASIVKIIPQPSSPPAPQTARRNSPIKELEPVRTSTGDGRVAGAKVYSFRRYQLGSGAPVTGQTRAEEYDLSPASPLSNVLMRTAGGPPTMASTITRRNSGLVAQLLASSLTTAAVDSGTSSSPSVGPTIRHLIPVQSSVVSAASQAPPAAAPTAMNQWKLRKYPQKSFASTPVISTPPMEAPHVSELLLPVSPSEHQPRRPPPRQELTVVTSPPPHAANVGADVGADVGAEVGPQHAEGAKLAVSQSVNSGGTHSTSDEALTDTIVSLSTTVHAPLEPMHAPPILHAPLEPMHVNSSATAGSSTSLSLGSLSGGDMIGGTEVPSSASSVSSYHSAISEGGKTPAGSIRRRPQIVVPAGFMLVPEVVKHTLPSLLTGPVDPSPHLPSLIAGQSLIAVSSEVSIEEFASMPPIPAQIVPEDLPTGRSPSRGVKRSAAARGGTIRSLSWSTDFVLDNVQPPLSPLSVESPKDISPRLATRGGARRKRTSSRIAISGETLRSSVAETVLDSTVIHVPDDVFFFASPVVAIPDQVPEREQRMSFTGAFPPPPTISTVYAAGEAVVLERPPAIPAAPPLVPASMDVTTASPGKATAPPQIPFSIAGGGPGKSAAPPMPLACSPGKSAAPPMPPILPAGSPSKSAAPPMPPSLPAGSPGKSAAPPMPPGGSPAKSSAPPLPASLSGLALGAKATCLPIKHAGPNLVPLNAKMTMGDGNGGLIPAMGVQLASPRISSVPLPSPIAKAASSVRPMAPIPFTNQNNAPYKMGIAPPKMPPPILAGGEVDSSQELLPLGRRLYWKTLRNVNDTIWETMKSADAADNGLDFDDMQFVFKAEEKISSTLTATTSTGGLGKSGTGGILDSQLITLLEAKRAQNIGVVIARVPVELVTEKLTDLKTDDGALSVEIFERLKTVLPTDDEVAYFNQYKGDVVKLRDIEKRIFSLFRLPRLSARIKFCLITLQLPIVFGEVGSEISTLRKCVSEIRTSHKLKKLLHVVLMLGNYVNHGASGTGARGFSIESLSKLAEFKSQTDSGITTLHFLAARLLKMDSKIIEEIYSDLSCLKIASRIASESIIQTLNSIKRDPEIVKHEISNHGQMYNEFALERLERFVAETQPIIDGLCSDWSLCEKELIDIRKFFGEDPKKISPDEFFNHLRAFLDNLLSTCADLKKRPKKFAKILATDAKEQGNGGPTTNSEPGTLSAAEDMSGSDPSISPPAVDI